MLRFYSERLALILERVVSFPICTLALVASIASIFCLGSEAFQSGAKNREVRLTFNSYPPKVDFPNPIFIVLRENGDTTALSYSEYQRKVLDVFIGKLSKAETDSIFARTKHSSFIEALKRGYFGNTGNTVEEGDSFSLSIEPELGKAYGLEHKSPEVIRKLITDLIMLPKRLKRTLPLEAYITSENIEKERFDVLKREGKLNFISVGSLPTQLQTIVSSVINQPYDFYSLSKVQHDEILKYASYGHDIYIIADGSGYKLRLFLGK